MKRKLTAYGLLAVACVSVFAADWPTGSEWLPPDWWNWYDVQDRPRRIESVISMGDGLGNGAGLGFMGYPNAANPKGENAWLTMEEMNETEVKFMHVETVDADDDPSEMDGSRGLPFRHTSFQLHRSALHSGSDDELDHPADIASAYTGRTFLSFLGQVAALDNPADNIWAGNRIVNGVRVSDEHMMREDHYWGVVGSASISPIRMIPNRHEIIASADVPNVVPRFGSLTGVLGATNYIDIHDNHSAFSFGHINRMVGGHFWTNPTMRTVDNVRSGAIPGSSEYALGVQGAVDAYTLGADTGYSVRDAIAGSFFVRAADDAQVAPGSGITNAYGVYVGDPETDKAIEGDLITNAYGVYIAENDIVGAGQDWSLVAEGDVDLQGTTYANSVDVTNNVVVGNQIQVGSALSLQGGSSPTVSTGDNLLLYGDGGVSIQSGVGLVDIAGSDVHLSTGGSPVLVQGALSVTGTATLGDSSADTHTVNGNVTMNHNATVAGNLTINGGSGTTLQITDNGGPPGTQITSSGSLYLGAGSGGINIVGTSVSHMGNYSLTGDHFVSGNLSVNGTANVLGDAATDQTTVNGDLAVVDTEWEDHFASAMPRRSGDDTMWTISEDYVQWASDAVGGFVSVPLDYPDDSIITQARLKIYGQTYDTYTISLMRRDDSSTTGAATTVATTTVSPSSANTVQVLTLNLPDHTILANNSYLVKVEILSFSGAARLYSVGIETSRREY